MEELLIISAKISVALCLNLANVTKITQARTYLIVIIDYLKYLFKVDHVIGTFCDW